MNTIPRKIIHIDMDAFYASVEIKDNPSLKGLPLVIGGPPNTRSVVCTASYEARRFGIHSAMACSVAARLCPQALFLPPRFDRYKAISEQIRDIFYRYTDIVEPLSLDEAYLDVTSQKRYATEIAKAIKEDILKELELTCSAGVGPNKLIAKIASDYRKPNGLTVVRPEQVQAFIGPLSVRKIHGVGPATEARLHAQQLFYCRDIWNYSPEQFIALLGNWGEWLWYAAKGEDSRPVETHWERKSYGKEDTFEEDILDLSQLTTKLSHLAERISKSLHKEEKKGRTITLKVKYHDFETITRRITLNTATDSAELIASTAIELLHQKTQAGERAVRLLGISMSNF